MKLYLIAGEASGDLIGGKIMSALRTSVSNIEFTGIGGKDMEAQGIKSLFPINRISLMGFMEIIPHIFKLKRLINLTVEDIIQKKPDALLTIDSPGFTYRVASLVRKKAPYIKLIHTVAPSVWAYKPKRAIKYAALYDSLLTLLPFEPSYFTEYGLDTHFIGHPALERHFYTKNDDLRQELGLPLDKKIIAVTPGSRKGEIRRHMPIIVESLERIAAQNIQVIFIQQDENNISLIKDYLNGVTFDYIFSSNPLKAFAASDAALAKSGTNTLEIAASGTPMVTFYKLNPITFFILKTMIKIKYACLINIIADKELIPEYIQSDFTAANIAKALNTFLSNNILSYDQTHEAQTILTSIGLNRQEPPSSRAAKIIAAILTNGK